MPISKKQTQNALGAAFWEKHVNSHKHSQLSQGEYCRRNRLKLSAFGYWYRKLNHHTASKLVKAKQPTHAKTDFIEISSLVNNRKQSSHSAPTCLELECGNGWKIKLPSGWEPGSLKQLLAILKEEACL